MANIIDRMPATCIKDVRYSNMGELVEAYAEKHPDAYCFSYHQKKELIKVDHKTFKKEIISVIHSLNLKDEERKHIAIVGENSYKWLLCYFAITCTGNVAVAIDKELPSNEIAELVKYGDCERVIISNSYIDVVDTSLLEGVEVINMKDIDKDSVYEGERVDRVKDNESMSCIFFTSGTSGKSKGVMLSQKNISDDIESVYRTFYGNTAFIDAVSVLPFNHAFGLNVGILTVYRFGCPNHITGSLKKVVKDIQELKPHTLCLVPLFVERFYKTIWSKAEESGKAKGLKFLIKVSNCLMAIGIDMRRKLFKSVLESFGGNFENVICGGAALDNMYIDFFHSIGVEVLCGYGATECSPVISTLSNFKEYKKYGGTGKPLDCCKVEIAEDGEIIVTGSNVALGYYKMPPAADNNFDGNGSYHTGDLGCLVEGRIKITGRKKNLIILSNGENISPEELENDIARDQNVEEVLVYDKNGIIIAEVFPTESHLGDKGYFDELMKKVNAGRPLYKQVAEVKLRDTEFIKNTSKKIVRHLNIKN